MKSATAALTEAREEMSLLRKVILMVGLAFSTHEIRADALVWLRPVKKMCAGLWAARVESEPAPRPGGWECQYFIDMICFCCFGARLTCGSSCYQDHLSSKAGYILGWIEVGHVVRSGGCLLLIDCVEG